jgi:hypothetical protein
VSALVVCGVEFGALLQTNYPKEFGIQSRLIGFKDASIPMSQALDPDPGRVGGNGSKELSG